MTKQRFEALVEETLARCKAVLGIKEGEYARGDRLHIFKQAAHLMQVRPIDALAGMMAKHTVSVYDMIADGRDHPNEVWREKITDSINYLLLLTAILEEKEGADNDKR